MKFCAIHLHFILIIYQLKALNISRLTQIYNGVCGGNSDCELIEDNRDFLFKHGTFCFPCSCNSNCVIRGDCCPDVFFQLQPSCTDIRLLRLRFDWKQYSTLSVLMIDKCPQNADNKTIQRCESVQTLDEKLSYPPVTSMKNNLTYKNIYCAKCFNESEANLTLWRLYLSCEKFADFNFASSYKEILDLAKARTCNINYVQAQGCSRICTNQEYNIITKCNISGTWETFDPDIEFACETYDNQFRFFKNVFCYICNPPRPDLTIKIPTDGGKNNIVCGLYYKDYEGRQFLRSGASVTTLFRLIFSISSYRTETRSQQISKLCNESQVYYPLKNECRDILCHPGRYLERNECIPLLQTTYNLGYTWSFGLKSVTKIHVNNTAAFLQAVENNIRSFVKEYLQVQSINFESSYLFTNLTCMVSEHWINGSDIIIITLYQKIFITEIVNRPLIENKLSNLYNNRLNVSYDHTVYEFIVYNDNSAFHLSQNISILEFPKLCLRTRFKNEYQDANKYVHSHVSRLLFCKQIELTENEFRLDMKSLKLCQTSDICEIEIKEYNLIEYKRARICLEDFETFSSARIQVNSKSHNILVIINLICTLISLLCLFITFITYCVFPSLRTIPGKNNMCLVFAMFIAHSLFQFGISANHAVIGCKIIGILVHYFWLSTFGCFNVCSLHMYRVFRSKTQLHLSRNEQQNRIVKKYILYAFGTPAVIISINITITFVTSKSVGYAGNICFLNEPIAVVATFIIPITLACISNIYFFIATSLKIASSPKVESDDQHSSLNHVQFTVYIKLFTITGITWIFQIIDSFLPMSEFSTVVSFMNTLQGVFIFIAYICNKRVIYLWKQSRKKNNDQT